LEISELVDELMDAPMLAAAKAALDGRKTVANCVLSSVLVKLLPLTKLEKVVCPSA
jgi:hypothetical protein